MRYLYFFIFILFFYSCRSGEVVRNEKIVKQDSVSLRTNTLVLDSLAETVSLWNVNEAEDTTHTFFTFSGDTLVKTQIRRLRRIGFMRKAKGISRVVQHQSDTTQIRKVTQVREKKTKRSRPSSRFSPVSWLLYGAVLTLVIFLIHHLRKR